MDKTLNGSRHGAGAVLAAVEPQASWKAKSSVPDRGGKHHRTGRPRRQLGHDRRTQPLPVVPPPISDRRIGLARLFIVGTVLAWASYVVYWLFEDIFNTYQRSSVGRAEAVVYLLVVTLLSASSLAYLLARLGFSYRAKSHRRATRAMLDDFYEQTRPTMTALVPSYQEDARVVRNTLLSVALQEYPDLHVVLLIDDPVAPRDRRARQLLEAARALPGEIEELLSWPSARFSEAAERFEASAPVAGAISGTALSALVAEYRAGGAWLENLAASQDLVDHTDAFLANHVLRRLALDLSTVADALAQALSEGATIPVERARQLYRRLVWTFTANVSSFQRKQYVSLSHEPNKAMNLNSYIGLMGRVYRTVQTVAGPALVPGDVDDPSAWMVRDPDYVMTLDADSVLLPEYCLRLVHILEQQEHRGDAVAQTPYSAFPGSATRLERVAGATTDVQHMVHQGLTYYDATFWVGANAVIRKKALDEIAETSYLGDWEVRTYIRDRTVIEDTDSTLDMRVKGWKLFNVPERLSYSATPPDFGSLCIQRQRWGTGGMLIVPKIRLSARAARERGGRTRFVEKFLRWNYMASITWSSLSLLVLLAFPFNATLISPLLGLTALPYFWAMTMDLRYCGYKRLDIARVYGFNLLLVPINLAGAAATLVQAITASKGAFIRTPKVRNRTVTPLIFVVAPYLLLLLAAYTCYMSYRHGLWEDMAYAGVNVALLLYAIVAFIGLGNSVIDTLTHLRSALVKPQRGQRRLFWRRSPQLAPAMADWRSVLDLGTPSTAEQHHLLASRPSHGGSPAGASWQLPEDGEFDTLFQPLVELSSGSVIGYEALSRFHDGTPVERWLAEAVGAGQGTVLEGRLARAALAEAPYLPKEGPLAVKVSPRLLHSDPDLRRALASLDRPVLVEVVEPSSSDLSDELREIGRVLPPKALVVLDQAGLGHKTIAVMLELRPAYVKLARRVVDGLAEDGTRQVHLAQLARMAREVGSSVVATGVETPEQRDLLTGLGVALGQGWLYGRPERLELPEGVRRKAPLAAAGASRPRGARGPVTVMAAGTGDLDLSQAEDRHRPHLSLTRALVAAAVVGGLGYLGVYKVPSAVQSAFSVKGSTWFAPYVDATLAPTYQFQDPAAEPARQVVLGFVVAGAKGSCRPSWGGYYSLAQADEALALGPRLAQLSQEGVGAAISFGGRNGTDLAAACTRPAALEKAYTTVLSHYKVSVADFDVEGAALADAAAVQRRAVALAAVQRSYRAHHRSLQVWLTLPSTSRGLSPEAMSVVNAMLRHRVLLSGVNIMAMDFPAPPRAGGTMFGLVRQAALATDSQLRADLGRFGAKLSPEQVWQRLGVTVMIGQNDVPGEVFTTADATRLVAFATRNGLGRLSMWSLNRDSQCGQGYGVTGVLSDTCSGTYQAAQAFSTAFSHLGRVLASTPVNGGIRVAQPDTNPANALYPLWTPMAGYEAGYKVVRDGFIYQSKWYNSAQDPAQTYPNAYADPWELLGPVLPSDHAPKLPVLPAGTYPAWGPGSAYQAGARVLYQGLPYQAKWYNRATSPGQEASDPFGSPWAPLFTLPGEPPLAG